MILPLLTRTRKQSDYGIITKLNIDRKPWSPCRKAPTTSLWVVAICFAAVCCYRAEVGEIGLLVSHCNVLKLLGEMELISRSQH